MKIVDYFLSENKNNWLSQIKNCDWSAAKFLAEIIDDGRFYILLGKSSRLFLLADGNQLVSFCTLSERDDIPDTELTPWIGFVYTLPQYRGNRYAGRLLKHAADCAGSCGYKHIYISTNEIGLYEKYGCKFWKTMTDSNGEPSRIYVLDI